MDAYLHNNFSGGGDLQCFDPLLLVLAHSWWAIFLYPLISATNLLSAFSDSLFELIVHVPWWITETNWQVSSLPDDHHAGVLAVVLLHLPFNWNAEYINTKYINTTKLLSAEMVFARGWPLSYCPVLAQ